MSTATSTLKSQRLFANSRRQLAVVTPVSIIVLCIVLAAYAWFFLDAADVASGGPRFATPGTSGHLLGTDHLGRDLLNRMLMGLAPTLTVGIAAAMSSAFIGLSVGAISGYWGGPIDSILMRIAEFFQTLPKFVVALIVVALFGGGTTLVTLVIASLIWPQMARVSRAQFLSLRSAPFVEAARLGGMPSRSILVREMLPNVFGPVVVIATLNVAAAILIEAGLSFLGLGDPSRPTLGAMLQTAQPHLRTAWWMSIFPGATISIIILTFNLLGDVLSDRYRDRMTR